MFQVALSGGNTGEKGEESWNDSLFSLHWREGRREGGLDNRVRQE